MTQAFAHRLAVLLMSTANNPLLMSQVLSLAEQLHDSLPPGAITEALSQRPLGGFVDIAMMQLCPNGLEETQDSQITLALAVLTGMYVNGFVHGALAATTPSLKPPQ
jgi:hypothetical protein